MAAVAPALALGGCKLPQYSMEQGLKSECRDFGGLAGNALFQDAWKGLRPDRCWDVHTHLLGNGRSHAGVWVEPEMDHPKSTQERIRHWFFKNGACMGEDEDRFDAAMVERLQRIVDDFPAGAKFMLLAFDFTYDVSGRKREDLTTFSVANAYARRIAATKPGRFEWIASVHPYREDAVKELQAAKSAGARAMKWLPPSMGIDLRHAKCMPYYDALASLDMPLLVHVGDEEAVKGAQAHELANPAHLRAPLERGVRVIAAHCATLGAGYFDVFAQLMAERAFEGRLFGDISAVTQINRLEALPRLLSLAPSWEGRLLNGSDYPLPGILPIFSLNKLVAMGLLDEKVVPGIRQLREGNAFAFDLVLKRNLRMGKARFPDSIFETRGFFENV
jgi:predicted TIM-barrel fold metal-dependent hydrolase